MEISGSALLPLVAANDELHAGSGSRLGLGLWF